MYKQILLLSSLLLLLGCASKKENLTTKECSDSKAFSMQGEVYHNSLVNTQKAQLSDAMETKALLTATYLNPVLTKAPCAKALTAFRDDGEYFFVGVYLSDAQTHHFNSQGYNLTLNGLEPIEVLAVAKNDPLMKQMPMVDNWSSYYKVKFEKSSLDNFSLTFENDQFGKDVLSYSKEEKPLFDSLIGSYK